LRKKEVVGFLAEIASGRQDRGDVGSITSVGLPTLTQAQRNVLDGVSVLAHMSIRDWMVLENSIENRCSLVRLRMQMG
jgi:hypothetical protein